jgi:23S rRNA pseudouridine1911/1915/1917 synthase
VARTPEAQTDLVRQLQARSVTREYLALALGDIEHALIVDAPIGRHPTQRTTMAVVATGKAARTEVEPVRRFGAATLVRCRLATGRTHQIRVHLEAAGLPLLGDKLYGRRDEDFLAFVTSVKAGRPAGEVAPGEPGRHLLHASELAFDHPDTGARIRFTDPIPDDFVPWLEGMTEAN